MSAPVPLPLTWRILTTVHCPSCPQDWNFFPEQNGRFVRDAYCSNLECVQHGHVYTLELSLDCVQIVKVVKLTQESQPGPIDMEGLTPLQQDMRRANRCRMEFVQSGGRHRCFLATVHGGYHYVNEWGILYWAHPLQKFGQSTEEFMAQISCGECIMMRAADQTEEDMRKLPYMEMDWSVPCFIPFSGEFRKAK